MEELGGVHSMCQLVSVLDHVLELDPVWPTEFHFCDELF